MEISLKSLSGFDLITQIPQHNSELCSNYPAIIAGCLQRIADAAETLARDRTVLFSEREHFRLMAESAEKRAGDSGKQVVGLAMMVEKLRKSKKRGAKRATTKKKTTKKGRTP